MRGREKGSRWAVSMNPAVMAKKIKMKKLNRKIAGPNPLISSMNTAKKMPMKRWEKLFSLMVTKLNKTKLLL